MITAKKTKIAFPDSGQEAHFIPVSMAAVMLRYQRKYPRPMPPLVDVDMGNGHKVKEFNYADPDYDSKVRKWEKFMAEQASFETLKRVQASLTLNQEQQAAVEEWKKENPTMWDESDKDRDLWLEQIAIATNEDFQVWMNFVQNGGQPASEEVKAIQDGFQDTV